MSFPTLPTEWATLAPNARRATSSWADLIEGQVVGPLHVNVKDARYGATGDGVTDDTAAIEAAWADLISTSSGWYAGTDGYYARKGPRLFFPAGDYVYNGAGLDNSGGAGSFHIEGDGAESTRIIIADDAYFLKPSTFINSATIEGIQFKGGAGAYKGTYTSANVGLGLRFRGCLFKDYTVCAVGHRSSDFPYVSFEHCTFDGALTGTDYTSIGICLSGDSSGSNIRNCHFFRNKYHIKLMRAGLSVEVSGCDFLRFEASPDRTGLCADILCVPHTASVNAGNGLRVHDNKFGLENLNTNDYHLLYADEDTGAGSDSTEYAHKSTASTGYVDGHHIYGNSFAGTSAAPLPIIYSTTDNVLSFLIEGNHYHGTQPTYAIAFLSGTAPDYTTTQSVVGPNYSYSNGSGGIASVPISNVHGRGALVDPTGQGEGLSTNPHTFPGGAFDPSFVNLLTTRINSFTLGSATKTTDTDVLGGGDAAEFTATGANQSALTSFTTTPTVGQPVYIEFDAKAGASSTLTTFQVWARYTSNGVIHFSRTVTVPSSWQRFRYRWIPRQASTTLVLYFVFPAAGAVKIGRPYVYQAREPVNLGPVKVQGAARIWSGTGSPESAVVGSVGDLYLRTDGSTSTTLYVKESGTGNTGWVAK